MIDTVAQSVLACPMCRGPLDETALRCRTCGRRYPSHDGRPVLRIDADVDAPKANPVMDFHADLRTGARRTGLRRWADRVREWSTTSVFTDDRVQVPLLVERARSRVAKGALVVDVGGGEQPYRADLEKLGRVLTIDVSAYGPTDVVGDGHRLPLRDASVDVITTISVLEHLARPWVFFSEVARVLKPGGLLLGVAPQYCPTHGFPSDYFRFTRGAINELSSFAGLDVVDAWPIGGPWATLFHWYWANHSRESSLRRVPVVGVGYHAYFQALSAIADRLDAESDHGARGRAQEHVDHVGWSFVSRKPG